MAKKKKKPKPKIIPLTPGMQKLYGKRDYKYGDQVRAKLSKDIIVKGKVLARANFPDIFDWFVIKVNGLKIKDGGLTTVSHDKIMLRAKKVK